MDTILSTLLESLDDKVAHDRRVRFFPVRHYSPTSARMVRQLIDEMNPIAVLIEGPSDYNEQIDELMLDHKLPVALYSYVRYSDNTRGSAFYPFCEFCPEWQAIEGGYAHEVPVRFIDMPWHEVAEHASQNHRYADRPHNDNLYIEELCRRLQVENFDEVWDVLFELDPKLEPKSYLERAYHFCYQLRYMSGGASVEDQIREEFMAAQIQEMLDAHKEGTVLVVTGGFHTPALHARLQGHDLEALHMPLPEVPEEAQVEEVQEDAEQVELSPEEREEAEAMLAALEAQPPKKLIDHGVTLTPFTYDRVDRMSGYQSGVHGPAFYEYAWETRKKGEALDGRPLLYEVIQRLRKKGQILSTSDAIAVETTAWSLARMRGRTEIWRYDLLDALSASVIKEVQDAEYQHPMLQEVRKVFCGEKRGSIDPNASLPPLVRKARGQFEKLHLTPENKERTFKLELLKAKDLEKSRVLHRCRMLGISGFKLVEQTDLVARQDMAKPIERWTLQWSPNYEASLIEASIYGADLGEAAFSKLLENAQAVERDAEKAALLIIDATLMGLESSMQEFYDRLLDIVRRDADFFKLSSALNHLLYLYAFDAVFGARDSQHIGHVLAEAYQRALWLFEGLGVVRDRDRELMDAIGSIFYTFQRCEDEPFVDRENFVELFERITQDDEQMPMVRGATLGGLYAMHSAQVPLILSMIRYFNDPMLLSDFLIGLFSLAREAAQRDPRLLGMLDARLMQMNDEEFWSTVPGFRLAFTFFTPREKTQLISILFPDQSEQAEDKIPGITGHTWQEAHDLGDRLVAALGQYSLRSPRQTPSLEGAATSRFEEYTQPVQHEEVDLHDHDEASVEDASTVELHHEDLPDFSEEERMQRWKVVLGIGAENLQCDMPAGWEEREQAVGFLYDREYERGRNIRSGGRQGGSEASQLTVPDWINDVHNLFPKRVIERLEKDALERYHLEELVTRPELLQKAKPNMTLMKAVLRTKHLMNNDVLQIAKRLVRKVVEDLLEKFSREVHTPFIGAANRRHRSYLKIAKNFDARETIRRNLKNWDQEEEAIIVKDPYFFSRVRRQVDKWQIIIVVDESGSMMDSVIHSAICASIFWGIKALKTNLIIFDTEVVDLTDQCDDPVETLMKVQLGGGTDIAKAMQYAATIVENPRRTIVVLVTDFYEGGNRADLIRTTQNMVESGVKVLGLAALDGEANPTYDRELAQILVNKGAKVGAMTPGELAAWVSDVVM